MQAASQGDLKGLGPVVGKGFVKNTSKDKKKRFAEILRKGKG
jgi:hypothetical protein